MVYISMVCRPHEASRTLSVIRVHVWRQMMAFNELQQVMALSLIYVKLECGPMPNVMVALPNIGGALCSTPQSLADAHY